MQHKILLELAVSTANKRRSLFYCNTWNGNQREFFTPFQIIKMRSEFGLAGSLNPILLVRAK